MHRNPISLRALVSETLFFYDLLFCHKTTFFSWYRDIFTVFLAFFKTLVRKVVDLFRIRIRTGTGTAGNGMESNGNRTDGHIMEPQVSTYEH